MSVSPPTVSCHFVSAADAGLKLIRPYVIAQAMSREWINGLVCTTIYLALMCSGLFCHLAAPSNSKEDQKVIKQSYEKTEIFCVQQHRRLRHLSVAQNLQSWR